MRCLRGRGIEREVRGREDDRQAARTEDGGGTT